MQFARAGGIGKFRWANWVSNIGEKYGEEYHSFFRIP